VSRQEFRQVSLDDRRAESSRGTGLAKGVTGTNQVIEERSPAMTSENTRVNAAIVRSLLELAFNGRRPAEAAATYLGASYRQVDPPESGTTAFVRLAEGYLRASPELRFTLQLLLADGDVVVTQSLIQVDANDRGHQVTDTFELADGRIVCHWEVMQDLPESLARATSAA
jgi:predicted SnoaL-like aldol condensation-catalyzing enzyme